MSQAIIKKLKSLKKSRTKAYIHAEVDKLIEKCNDDDLLKVLEKIRESHSTTWIHNTIDKLNGKIEPEENI